jgi:chemotaxis protein MotB
MREKENEWIAIADLMAGAVGVVLLFFVLAALKSSQFQSSVIADQKRAEILSLIADVVNKRGGGITQIVLAEDDLIRVPSDNMFETGQTAPNARGKSVSKLLYDELSKILPCYVDNPDADILCTNERPMRICIPSSITSCRTPEPFFETVLIEGHADSRQASVKCDNWCLSTERANEILKFGRLYASGLFRLKNESGELVFGLAGYGDSRPIEGMESSDDRQRRVDFRFIIEPSQR